MLTLVTVTPKIPQGYQGNVQCGGLSIVQSKPLTLGQVISEAPLAVLATLIRTITNSVDSESLQETLARIAPIKDKTKLQKTLDCLPPTSLVTTDWRGVTICDLDFGFGRPVAVRMLADEVLDNLLVLYPRRADPDHGMELVVPFERHAVDDLINDPDMNKYFDFWGTESHGLSSQ